MNRNKERGKRFENKIANVIRECWGLRKDECHRAQSSGTFTSDYSDIIIRPFEYKLPHIIIECKYRNSKTLTYNKLLNPGNLLDKFYEQIDEAGYKYLEEYETTPLKLITYGTPNMRPIVAIEETEFLHLQQYPETYNLQYHSNMFNTLTLFMKVRTLKFVFIQMFVDELFGKLISPIEK